MIQIRTPDSGLTGGRSPWWWPSLEYSHSLGGAMATKRQRRRRRPAHWMDAGFSPLWSEAHISFHRRIVRTGRFKVMPMVQLEASNGNKTRAYPDGYADEVIYGLALRAHRLERQARRDAARIRRLEQELAACRGAGGPILWADASPVVGLPSKEVRRPLGDGWTFPFERAQGFLALAPRDDEQPSHTEGGA